MVAIPTAGTDLMADVEQRFGRCPRFLIVNSETMEYRSVPNAASFQSGGAGITAAQQVINEGAEFVIAGEVGPNAFEVLNKANVKVYARVSGTIRDAVEMLMAGTLRGAMEPTGPALHGGRGRGMGRQDRGP
jgi:predicted Fe-Mo cluster-binding NifX family protein